MKNLFIVLITLLNTSCFTPSIMNVRSSSSVVFSPASGSVGSVITLTGADFSSLTAAFISGVSAIVLNKSSTSAQILIMPGMAYSRISLTFSSGTTSTADFFTPTANPLVSSQQAKLIGSDTVAPAFQAQSVALSGDGNTAVVGAGSDNGNIGAALVYTRSNGVWTQQGPKLIGTGYVASPTQGSGVAICGDGNTILVGGQGDSFTNGAFWFFTRSNGVWTQEGSKMNGSAGSGSERQGAAVALSADCSTAMIGAYGDSGFAGAFWIFARSGSTWVQQGGKYVGTGATGASRQGWSVALSGDGNTAFEGGYADNGGIGGAWVFTRSGSTWTQQGSMLIGTGATGAANQGNSVATSIDGNTLVVGGPQDNGVVGAGWIYTRSGSTWTQQGAKLFGPGTGYQGGSVAISADGNTMLLGANSDSGNIGALWRFTRSGSTWTQVGPKLVGTGSIGNPQQCWSMAISSDASTAICGGPQDNASNGAAWVYGP